MLKLKKLAEFSDCVQAARELFDELFDAKIRELLSVFPKNHLD